MSPHGSSSTDRAARPNAFEALLAWLDADREQAGRAYERFRERLTRYFEWRGCDTSDALADDVLDRVGRRLVEGEVVRTQDHGQYVYGVARLVCLEALKRQKRRRAALEAQPLSVSGSTWPEVEELDHRLMTCLEELSREQRQFILRYYEHDGQARISARQRLAAEMGAPLNALRIRAHRLRDRLAACLGRGRRSDET